MLGGQRQSPKPASTHRQGSAGLEVGTLSKPRELHIAAKEEKEVGRTPHSFSHCKTEVSSGNTTAQDGASARDPPGEPAGPPRESFSACPGRVSLIRKEAGETPASPTPQSTGWAGASQQGDNSAAGTGELGRGVGPQGAGNGLRVQAGSKCTKQTTSKHALGPGRGEAGPRLQPPLPGFQTGNK